MSFEPSASQLDPEVRAQQSRRWIRQSIVISVVGVIVFAVPFTKIFTPEVGASFVVGGFCITTLGLGLFARFLRRELAEPSLQFFEPLPGESRSELSISIPQLEWDYGPHSNASEAEKSIYRTVQGREIHFQGDEIWIYYPLLWSLSTVPIVKELIRTASPYFKVQLTDVTHFEIKDSSYGSVGASPPCFRMFCPRGSFTLSELAESSAIETWFTDDSGRELPFEILILREHFEGKEQALVDRLRKSLKIAIQVEHDLK